jgi:uncharacterized integral membrane protein (TIGR00697 family)
VENNLALHAARRQWLFVILAAFFVTNAVTAELISNKLISIPIEFNFGDMHLGPFITIVGVLPWPIVFLITDLINEFYGYKAIRKLSWITAVMIVFVFIIVSLAIAIPAAEIAGAGTASDQEFRKVLGQGRWIIVGSITAFLLSQILDATLFAWIKQRTGNKMIWLRSTGSTMISQLFDSYIVLYIGFILPGTLPADALWTIAPVNYFLKILIAIALTPLIYAGHFSIRKYLGHEANATH